MKRNMEKYSHGGDIYDKNIWLDFSVNTNPLGLPGAIKNVLKNNPSIFSLYPDPQCRSLIRALAEYEKMPDSFIICGNGASDLIFRLCYAKMPKKSLVMAPTFSEYEKALEAVGCQVEHFYLEEENDFQITGNFLESLDHSLDMVFLCNPNNPTGKLIPKDILERILKCCEENHIFLVVDECFIDFTDDPQGNSCTSNLKQNTNLFILKAFTKTFSMAGLRLGYGLCSNQKLLDKIMVQSPTWSVSVPAQIAGIEALKQVPFLEKTKKLVKKEREYLQGQLAALGMKVYPSSANYILFHWRHQNLYEKTLEEGILIRQCSNYYGLGKEYYRIAIKRHKENEILIKSLKSIIKAPNEKHRLK